MATTRDVKHKKLLTLKNSENFLSGFKLRRKQRLQDRRKPFKILRINQLMNRNKTIVTASSKSKRRIKNWRQIWNGSSSSLKMTSQDWSRRWTRIYLQIQSTIGNKQKQLRIWSKKDKKCLRPKMNTLTADYSVFYPLHYDCRESVLTNKFREIGE